MNALINPAHVGFAEAQLARESTSRPDQCKCDRCRATGPACTGRTARRSGCAVGPRRSDPRLRMSEERHSSAGIDTDSKLGCLSRLARTQWLPGLATQFKKACRSLPAADAHRHHAIQALRRTISLAMVPTRRVPVMPKGCPIAMEPPLTFSLLGRSPVDRGNRRLARQTLRSVPTNQCR